MHRGAERPVKGRATERVTVRRTYLCRTGTAVAAYRAAPAVPATAVAAYIAEVAECDCPRFVFPRTNVIGGCQDKGYRRQIADRIALALMRRLVLVHCFSTQRPCTRLRTG